jgi:uncharacterized protein (TIGR03083 family)
MSNAELPSPSDATPIARPWDLRPFEVRRAFAAAALDLVILAGAIPADRWEAPGLDQWSVRHLTGHASRALVTVETYLDAGAGQPVEITVDGILDYYNVLSSGYADPAQIVARGRDAGAALGNDPAATLGAMAERVLARLDGADDGTPVPTPAGGMRLIDYLPTRIVELVIHGLDLARATALPARPDPGALAVTAAVLAGLTAQRPDAGTVLLALTGRASLPAGYSLF